MIRLVQHQLPVTVATERSHETVSKFCDEVTEAVSCPSELFVSRPRKSPSEDVFA